MRDRCRKPLPGPSFAPRMGLSPDGMKRMSLWVTTLAVSGLLALPSGAAEPSAWRASSGVSGSFTVLRAVSGSTALAGGFDGALLRTTDAGNTWDATTPPTDAGLRDIASPDGQTLFVLDARGAVMRSTDAGAGWTTLAPAGGAHPLALGAIGGNGCSWCRGARCSSPATTGTRSARSRRSSRARTDSDRSIAPPRLWSYPCHARCSYRRTPAVRDS